MDFAESLPVTIPPPPLMVCGVPRNPKWESFARRKIANHPFCAACGTTENLEVHHYKPFHEFPELELDEENTEVVCRTDHFVLCHFHHWESWNPDCKEDLIEYRKKLERRPKRAA